MCKENTSIPGASSKKPTDPSTTARIARPNRGRRGARAHRGASRPARIPKSNPTHPNSRNPNNPPICRHFAKTGTCAFGKRCRYSHILPDLTPSNTSPAANHSVLPQPSNNVVEFITQLDRDIRRPKFTLHLDDPEIKNLWLNSWAAVAVGATVTSAGALLRAYMHLPASTAIAPQPHHVLQTLSSNVDHSLRTSKRSKAAVVNTLQLVTDIIEHRLLPNQTAVPDHLRTDCVTAADHLRTTAHAALISVITDPNHAERASRLLCRFLELLQRYSRHLETANNTPTEQQPNSNHPAWAGWRNATVDWLQRAAWLDVSQLQAWYDDLESYTKTLRELVTMLTFYWGAGAVFPKCRHRGQDGRPCDEPLCAVCTSGRRRPCGRRFSSGNVCSAPAKWRCSRKGHEIACDRCLRQLQTAVVGKPGPRASTDIYDAVVERETVRRGGLVHVLSKLESRKPPKIAPNWKTTYRLKCSALVGVVRLGASCEPLAPHQHLELAEIVPVHPVAGSATDFQERQKGRLALRLLTRGDLSSLSSRGEALEHGVRVAIIDMQVFVPEVLSVLSTVSDVEFPKHLEAIPFANSLICSTPRRYDSPEDDDMIVLISEALANTEIDLIRRLPVSALNALGLDLVQMAKRMSLDGTQLKAFAAALEKSLHCTQGPPGTGKSYLGVALIRALDIIRTYLLKAGIAVGPIVVLSYKNHALDEILIDVVKSDRRLNWRTGGLIRCGKPEDERLNPFRERNSPAESAAQEVLASRVGCMRWVNRTLRDWRSLRAAFLASADDENGEERMQDWTPSRCGKGRSANECIQKWMLQAVRAQLLIENMVDEPSSEWAYEVIDSLSSIWDRVEETIPYEGSSPFKRLEAEMEHWAHIGPSRKAFLLERWLLGASPPPRCIAHKEEGGCSMATTTPGAYCKEFHACWYRSGCNCRRDEGAQLCGMHRCSYGCQQQRQCHRARLPSSDVCDIHGCPRCIAIKAPRIQSKEFGAGACAQHKCKSPTCDGIGLFEQFPYCAQHGCRVCRRKIADNRSNEVRSAARVQGSQFCKEHKCAAPKCVRNRLTDEEFHQDFCVVHACIACDGERNRSSEICATSRLCDLHRCSQTYEQRNPCPERREKRSLFCESHTCRICVEEGLSLDRNVNGHPPRNVCVLHPLCAFVFANGSQCNRITGDKGQHYCERHVLRDFRNLPSSYEGRVEEMKCHGITTKGRPCKARGKVPVGSKYYYCAPHISQMPAPSSSSSGSDDDSDRDEGVLSSERDQNEEQFFDAMCGPSFETNLPVPAESADQKVVLQSLSPMHNDFKDSEENLDHAREPQEDKNSSTRDAKDTADVKSVQQPVQQESTSPPLTTPSTAVTQTQSEIEYNRLQSEHKAASHESVVIHTSVALVEGPHGQMVDIEGDGTCSSVDGDSANERLLFGTNPDECDIQLSDEESSDEDVPDHMQHLHDIIDNESMSGSESDEEQVINVIQEGDEGGCNNVYSHDPKEWNWSQRQAERYRLAAELLRHVCIAWTRIATIADAHVEKARRERAEAAGFVFKNARLVGATVVGATRRLQAIRASEPFAMIVEEACEVLEPTLVAVLAVRSLRKLELIGDHRQLPAFVQPCWFSIQITHPSIKVSLFERLVNSFSLEDGCDGSSACSVLDIQRRMRPEICDLTRCEYDDLVHILDDPCTISRRIGDGNNTNALGFERELWVSEGQNVPGVQSQVFFWNLKTQEGRAAVGLSRCNTGEAEACAKLVGWFLHCGVPASSISVITPYKGQKLTVIKLLRKVRGALPQRKNGIIRSDQKRVIVSTVDRYQGDENDIVILSLVCTRPGNRFIALRNRFIVASSRARLGFFVVGCTEALTKSAQGGDGPSHWRRFLHDLTQPEHHTAGEDGNVELKKVCRITDKFSICCPRHRETVLEISEPSEFPHLSQEKLAEFCEKSCPFLLPWCGHGCKVPCHSPASVPHTSKCNENVERPCLVHEDVVLHCHAVKDTYGASVESLEKALKVYDCEIMTEWLRSDCSHAVQVCCHEQKKLAEGTLELSSCIEKVADYVNPSCGHTITAPKCHTRRKWEDNPPQCQKLVVYERPCGCKARMPCHQRVHETSLDIAPFCKEAVSRSRPRCSHSLSSRCHEATVLTDTWAEQQGEAITSSPPLVIHGTDYGPSETQLSFDYRDRLHRKLPKCQILTQYQSSCGHIIMVPCSEAFELAGGRRKENLCTEEKAFQSPICGHHIRAPCYVSSLNVKPHAPLITGIDAEERELPSILKENVLECAQRLDQRLKKIGNSCSNSFRAIRTCGHITEGIPCRHLFSIINSKKLPPCEARMTLKRSCGHTFDAICHRKEDEPPTCMEAVDVEFVYPCGRPGHMVQPRTCAELTKLQGLVNLKCPIEVPCIRARCKHLVSVPCYLEQYITAVLPGACLESDSDCAVVHADTDYCEAAPHVTDCTEPVVYRRQCGHEEVGVQCNIAFEWATMFEEAPPCSDQVEIQSPLCDHFLKVPCHQKSLFHIDLWEGITAQRITTQYDEYPVTMPIVEESRSLPSHPPAGIAPLLNCGLTTRLVRSCGHEEDVPCESIFETLQSKCEKNESEQCPDCGHQIDVPCAKRKESASSSLCENIVEKICNSCGINTTKVECFKQTAHCQREVHSSLSCGHVITWTCGEDDPITESSAEKCLRCMKDQWTTALSGARETARAEFRSLKEGPSNSEHREANPYGSHFASLLGRIQDRAIQSFSPSCIQSSSMLTAFDAKHLWSAYLDILSCNIDLLSNAMTDGIDGGLEFRPPPTIFDARQSFDLVYCVLSARSNAEESFKHTDTVYGFGTEATSLSMEALELDCQRDGRNGSLSICVAAALKYRTLTDTHPFRTCKRRTGRKGKRVLREEAKARRLMQTYKMAGFDHVVYTDKERVYDRVYWIPGAVMPLMKLDIQLFVMCGICLLDMLPSKGWACPESHFLCRGCFITCIERATQPDCGARLVDGCGNLLCPHPGCAAKYEELSLLKQSHDGSENEIKILYEGLRKLKMAAHAKQEVNAALDVQKRQLQAEFQRVMQIRDLDERRAETLRLEIVDEVLTLRCPVETCRAAFLDFEGCFALTCSCCNIHFCAWCIRHCNAYDVHSHVRNCPERSADDLFHDLTVFQKHHRRRRKKLVLQRLRPEDADVRQRALTHLGPELRDLGIEIYQSDFQ